MLTAKVKHIGGLQLVGQSGSGHAIVMDGSKKFGGTETGVSPMEMLLLGLGGCTGMDVASVLKKKKQDMTGLEIDVRGEKADKHPMHYTKIQMEFTVTGRDLDPQAVDKAINLSMDKYCSVKATLEGVAEISWTRKIVQEQDSVPQG